MARGRVHARAGVEKGDRVSLPVIPARRVGRTARLRALVLVTVHVLIVAHVLHWWWTGRSLGRFVFSDSMSTLEIGQVNPGFVLFGVSLLATAVFGRFMCGWLCHMGALQDLCAWLMRKVGLRAHMFRSRLLGFVPTSMALYMFVWPTFRRDLLRPALTRVWPEGLSLIDPTPAFPGFSHALVSNDLWEGLPPVEVAVPFLIVCGFGMVWFLGARGLCRYGCPYGGLLLPVERIAPGRIVVDASRCDQCGLCTAACTGGVRVHEQVRDHGAVFDRNCVKSLDCIDVCPHGALSFGFRAPVLLVGGASKPTRYDLSLGMELLCLCVLGVTFFSVRGLYERIPFLFACSIAVLAAYFAWKAVCLWRLASVRVGGVQLKFKGALKPLGYAFIAAFCAGVFLVIQSAGVKLILLAASRADDRVTVSYEAALRGERLDAPQAASAARAEWLYGLARPWWRGGLALGESPAATVRQAWILLTLNRQEHAIWELRAIINGGRAPDATAADFAVLLEGLGRREEARDVLNSYLADHAGAGRSRDVLAGQLVRTGAVAEAERLYRDRLEDRPTDATARGGLGQLLVYLGDQKTGLRELELAVECSPRSAQLRHAQAVALLACGRLDDAVACLEQGAAAIPHEKAGLLGVAADMLSRSGQIDRAESLRASISGS